MTEYYIHTTGENERWDTLAAKYYGNCYEITPIIEANFHLPITDIFETGTEILIPILEKTPTDNLPIWKQQQK